MISKEESYEEINNLNKFDNSYYHLNHNKKKYNTVLIQKNNEYKVYIKTILDSNWELIIMAFLTCFVLFGPDLKVISLNSNHDPIFNSVYIFILVLFLLEFMGTWYVNPNYISTFFFWLDLFAIITMFLEIEWILLPLVDMFIEILTVSVSDYKEREYIKRSERDNKIFVALKIIRVIRLIRIVKLYKAAIFIQRNIEKNKQIKNMTISSKREKEENNSKINNISTGAFKDDSFKKSIFGYSKKENKLNFLDNNNESNKHIPNYDSINYDDLPSESKIGRIISDSITKKVIIIILLLFFISPITDDDIFSDDNLFSYQGICKLINNLNILHDINSKEIRNFILFTIGNSSRYGDLPIISIKYDNFTIYENKTINYNFRFYEMASAYSPGGFTEVVFSIREKVILTSIINIARTLFTIGCLYYMAIVLLKDSNTLILRPLQIMIKMVDELAKDPINPLFLDERDKKINKLMTFNNMNENNNFDMSHECSSYEIQIIKIATARISTLLSLGFGKASREILNENLKVMQEINPIFPGIKKNGIFCFCRIRNMKEIYKILQEKTIIFLNEISEIVHSYVDIFGGLLNKNTGDGFILVWKFGLDENELSISDISNKALLCILYIILKINKSPSILSYGNLPEIKNCKYFKRIFRIRISVGIHLGWGIEGPIGSQFKMDCTFISPDVNIASKLEKINQEYGVDILISNQIYNNISLPLQNICRKVDTIKLNSLDQKIDLYTIDITLENLKQGKYKKPQERRKLYDKKKSIILSNNDLTNFILNKKSFKSLLLNNKGKLFYEKFNKGLNYYIDGDWENAFKELKYADFIIDEEDEPTKVLLKFIEDNNKKKPEDWNGYRYLISK